MKAAIVARFGPPEVIEVRADLAEPAPPAQGELLIAVAGSGLNPADVKIRRGQRDSPALPYVPGREAAGTVLAVGEGVMRLQVGDRVFGYFQSWAKPGGNAERILVPAEFVAIAPSAISLLEAAAIPLAGSTALQAIRGLDVTSDDVLAVVGASGGVGTFAVQLAVLAGATVIAVARPDRGALLAELGVTATVDPEDAMALRELRFATHLLDLVGEVAAGRYREFLHPRVRAVSTNSAWKSVSPRVDYLRAQSRAADLATMATLVDDAGLRPIIYKTFALEDVIAAHGRLEAGHVPGKIVISI